MELASEKGASSWLTALPLTEHSFSLHKGAFRDALALRYGWFPLQTPAHCDCGANFSIDHSLSCPKGGFPSIRHNEIRNLTARLLTEVCHDVRVEPHLQPLTGEAPLASTAITQDGARLDVEVSGFWGGRFERTFMDVRIFNPHVSSNRNSHLSSTYRRHENTKKRAYEQRIQEVKRASFTPLIFSVSGGMAREATTFYKRLASLLSTKREQPYSSIMWRDACSNFLCSVLPFRTSEVPAPPKATPSAITRLPVTSSTVRHCCLVSQPTPISPKEIVWTISHLEFVLHTQK